MSEPKIDTVMAFWYVKHAFGSYAILDSVEDENLPSVLSFAKIVSNYKKMTTILKEN